jgi:hypothetical protein
MHFGSKDRLFESLWADLVASGLRELEWDPSDLPGFAGRVFDFYVGHPDTRRIWLWRLLESDGEAPIETIRPAALQEWTEEIHLAQAAGTISARFDARQLMLLTIVIAAMWSTISPDVADLIPDLDTRRQTVVDAVRGLVEA